MTDNEIINALECCDNCFCEQCHYKPKLLDCREELCKDALDLINRQKAEIERYKGVIKLLESDVQAAKTEAIKEFAERLKKGLLAYMCSDRIQFIKAEYELDNLVKEMAEVKENDRA